MNLQIIDWIIIGVFLVGSVLLGIYFSARSGKSMVEYFVSGRTLPWWLAGTSMIATGFSIDTALGITGFVATNGIPGVWFAWSFILGGAGVLGAFIFAGMLRRSEIITTAELVELRYSGKVASSLRLFKCFYFGVLSNCMVMAWVIKAVFTFSDATFDWDPLATLAFVLVLTLIYTTMSGLWGIVATDFIQFFVATSGSICLAWFALDHVGGLSGLLSGLERRYGIEKSEEMLSFIPSFESAFFPIFIVFITLKWWGNPPEVINQRIVASKNERHASFATMLFALVHLGLNYWPMIMVALVSLVVYPDLAKAEAETGYAKLIVELLPAGFLGLIYASLLAAFMSTIDSHLNVGSAYIVNDFYKRFINPSSDTKHYVKAGRISTVIMLALAVAISYFLDSVNQAWRYLAMLTAGYGVLLVMRWFWWRINAWSEIAALISSFVGSLIAHPILSRFIEDPPFGYKFLFILLLSTTSWVTVTLLTPPVKSERLHEFCRKVKPYSFGWKPIKARYDDIDWNPHFRRHILHFFLGAICIYSLCFSLGHLLFARYLFAILLLVCGLVSGAIILFTFRDGESK